jgi:hypothetical protein
MRATPSKHHGDVPSVAPAGATNKAPGGETGVEQANTPLARPPQSSPRDSACWTCSRASGALATTAGTAGTVVIDAVRGDPPGDRRLTPVTTDYAVPSSLQGRASGSGGFAVLIPSFSCAMRVSTPHHPAGVRAQASEAGEKRPVSDGAPGRRQVERRLRLGSSAPTRRLRRSCGHARLAADGDHPGTSFLLPFAIRSGSVPGPCPPDSGTPPLLAAAQG